MSHVHTENSGDYFVDAIARGMARREAQRGYEVPK